MSDDDLRRLGDRLEWLYPLEPGGDLIELIAPLLLGDAGNARSQEAGEEERGRTPRS